MMFADEMNFQNDFESVDENQNSITDFLSQTDQFGFHIFPSIYTSSGWNIAGGREITTDGNLEYLLDLTLKVSSEPLLRYDGGLFCADLQFKRGGFPSKDAGSFQFLTYIEARNLFQLFQLWYRQSFCEDKYWFKVGKTDFSEIIDYSIYAQYYQYQSFENIPVIRNVPYYPNSAMGVSVFLNPLSCFALTAGLIDGSNVLGVETGNIGVFGKFFSDLAHHAFIFAQFDFSWYKQKKHFGRMSIGGWRNTSEVHKFSGGTAKGMQGMYMVLDQTIWKPEDPKDPRLIGVFTQAGFTSPKTSPVKQLYAIGMNWTGIFPKRQLDQFGLGACMSRFSLEPGSGFIKPTETVIESYYIYSPYKWLAIQPDFQYIITPGGSGIPYALVALLNINMEF